MNYVNYKENGAVNLDNVVNISRRGYGEKLRIEFRDLSSCVKWYFSDAVKERDAVYKMVLKVAECSEIVLAD